MNSHNPLLRDIVQSLLRRGDYVDHELPGMSFTDERVHFYVPSDGYENSKRWSFCWNVDSVQEAYERCVTNGFISENEDRIFQIDDTSADYEDFRVRGTTTKNGSMTAHEKYLALEPKIKSHVYLASYLTKTFPSTMPALMKFARMGSDKIKYCEHMAREWKSHLYALKIPQNDTIVWTLTEKNQYDPCYMSQDERTTLVAANEMGTLFDGPCKNESECRAFIREAFFVLHDQGVTINYIRDDGAVVLNFK